MNTRRKAPEIPETSTVDQLRADIDSGLTGDKVRHADAAAAPLGTDEEAAGTPIDGHTVSQARRLERPPSAHDQPARRVGAAWILLIFIIACAAAIAAWMLLH